LKNCYKGGYDGPSVDRKILGDIQGLFRKNYLVFVGQCALDKIVHPMSTGFESHRAVMAFLVPELQAQDHRSVIWIVLYYVFEEFWVYLLMNLLAIF
jgi:hypothetical protein